MKRIQKKAILKLFICFILLSSLNSYGQDTIRYWNLERENDPFWQPNCPITDGFTLWLLRQKLNVSAYQTIMQSEFDVNNKNLYKIIFTNYIPLISKNQFSAMLGTRYSKLDVLSENNKINKTIQHIWLWTALQYRKNKWNFSFTAESYYKGDEYGLFDKTGNKFFTVSYIGYELNPKWQFILMGGYDIQQMEYKTKEKPLVAFETRFQPSKKFKMLFGVPTIFACEWSVFNKTDIGFNYFLSNGLSTFVQYRLAEKTNLTLQYYSDSYKSSDTYFITNQFFYDSNSISYNNITFSKSQLLSEIGFLTSKDLGINLGFGYNLKKQMSLYNNTDLVNNDYKTKANYFVSVRINYTPLFKQ